MQHQKVIYINEHSKYTKKNCPEVKPLLSILYEKSPLKSQNLQRHPKRFI